MSDSGNETLAPNCVGDSHVSFKELIASDSGIDTTESESTGCPASSESDASPEKHNQPESQTNTDITPLEKQVTKNCGSDANIQYHDEVRDIIVNSFKEILSDNLNLESSCHNSNINNGAIANLAIDKVKGTSSDNVNECDLDSHNRFLGISTMSLTETKPQNNMVSKSPFSKSAENLTLPEQNSDPSSLYSSNSDINADKILSQFVSHKPKVTATQKIPENQSTDAKFTRIPKELLPQDIGSIVKNVHGIFSSVSGSLKNAYNHTQKPIIKTVLKPIPNGKVMDDIFEEEKAERTQIVSQSTTASNLKIPAVPIENSLVLEHSSKLPEPSVEHEGEAKGDLYRLQIESLERVLAELRKENASLRERVKQQADEQNVKDQTLKEMEGKIDLMTKRVELAEREKDAAVMRYASVECAAIEAKRAAETSARAERSALNEVELMQTKLKSAHGEKQRICQLYDDKCHALQQSEREVSKVREEIRELEGRLKWTQSKLRMEMDAYKESAEKAERLAQQVTELESAKEAAAINATDSIRARQLESELKESQAALILCRHDNSELDKRLSSTSHLFDVCKRERDAACASLSKMAVEIEQLKASNLRLEEEAAELAALRAQAALADTLTAQLQRESERAQQAEESLTKERARAETCARREAAALEHSARLTNTHVRQRERAASSENKAQALAADNASLRDRISSLEQECATLQTMLSEETERRNKENKVLARKVAELTEDLSEATKKLEWEKGENSVLKKKHQSALKELNRELQRSMKRCEQLEAKMPQNDVNSNRTGSISSLSSSESAVQDERLQNGHSNDVPDVQNREPDRQTLIERIVSLQREAARRSDRCEFLEEHNRQLTDELRKKSKLLRHLMPNAPHGAMGSNTQIKHKKEIARLGSSSMAALWGDDPNGITLELSLEMNKKLQAVLEDTLLKNITLKENMDTLGEEISRLKQQKMTEAK